MISSAQIFTPADNSLEARIQAYKAMRNELKNIEASQKLTQSKEWRDRLGNEEELQQAHSIVKNSLRATLNNILDVDLEQAQQQGLISPNEIVEFSATKHSFENPVDSKQAQIDKNKAEIRKARTNTMSKVREIDNNIER